MSETVEQQTVAAPGPISQNEIGAAFSSAREQARDYDGRPLANAVCETLAIALRRRLPALAGSNLQQLEQLITDACARDVAELVESDFMDAVEDILWEVEDFLEL